MIDGLLIQRSNWLFYPGNQGVLAPTENPSPLNRWQRLQALMRGGDCASPKPPPRRRIEAISEQRSQA